MTVNELRAKLASELESFVKILLKSFVFTIIALENTLALLGICTKNLVGMLKNKKMFELIELFQNLTIEFNLHLNGM